MMNTKKLIKTARKWQQKAALKSKRIALARSISSQVERGCFVVYTTDKRQFAFSISYLRNPIFQEILKMSEEEFGLPSDGPIRLPFDSVFMEYFILLIQQRLGEDIEKALFTSISNNRCSLSSSLQQEQASQQLLVL